MRNFYRFYMNTNIQGDFQICIGVPFKQACLPNYMINHNENENDEKKKITQIRH